MSKPSLSQMIELIKESQTILYLNKGGKFHIVNCETAETAVEEFGDVEVQQIKVELIPKWEKSAPNEFKAMISVFI